MKKVLSVILALMLVLTLCSCGGSGDEAVTDAQGEEITTNAQGTYYVNPLNGQRMNEEYKGRVFAVTMNNVSPALPHKGLNSADLYFELFINDYCTRGLALYSDVRSVSDIGSIRSCRINFTDISQAFNAVLCHTNGSDLVMNDLYAAGIDQMGIDVPVGYRDSDRSAQGYAWEHTLFAKGESLYNAAATKGFNLEETGRDFGLEFTDNGTPDGEAVNEIEIIFTLKGITKTSTMAYDKDNDGYTYNQYGKTMTDGDATVYFKNVLVLLAPTENVLHGSDTYHVAELVGTGDGYFSCGGKYVAIKWTRETETSPFTFTLADGSEVELGTGNSYIAIAPTESTINMH